jgi:hypothetical protein
MTIKTVNIQFAMTAEEEPIAVVRDVNTYELLSVWSAKDAADLYRNLIRRDMRIDYNELRAVRPSEESST